MTSLDNCPVCNGTYTPGYPDDAPVTCSSCGQFAISFHDVRNLASSLSKGQYNRFEISALLRERTIRGGPRTWLQDESPSFEKSGYPVIDVKELLRNWPKTVSERLERTLCNFARKSRNGGDWVRVDHEARSVNFAEHQKAIAFAKTVDEARYNIEALVKRGYLEKGQVLNEYEDFRLTPTGWAEYERITRGAGSPENPAFVAMWFGDANEKSAMDKAYGQGIEPAVKDAGYRVTRVDLQEHNDWIMDKVLGDIRMAPFVVADYTGHRNGVYFEAGFARGLGIPVISTCREDHFENAHFDTKQLNHVRWTTPEELKKKLGNRILGTIGRGPYPAKADANPV